MCGKIAALVVCLSDTKTTHRDARMRPEMSQKIFFQLELRLNFVWYNIGVLRIQCSFQRIMKGKINMDCANNISYIGNYRPVPGSRAFNKAFWTSDVLFDGQSRRVVDAAGMDDDGHDVVNLIPYAPERPMVDKVIADGDLLAYVRDRNIIKIRLNVDALMPLLKGRASHAELCYRMADKARHISLWDAPNPICPTDCNAFHEHADNAALAIYRISLKDYGVDAQRELALKREVRKWKSIVRPVNFPNGDALNFDPVDFADMDSLAGIARRFLSHSPTDHRPPVDFKMNCVQWSTLVLSLSLCFPLTRKVVSKLGMQTSFETNWLSLVNGYAADNLSGLDELPIPFYSPMEVVENALDLYLPEKKLELLEFARKYPVESLLKSKGLRMDQCVIMPSAFIIENRLRKQGMPRKTKSTFEYVATALPEKELTLI